MHRHLLSIFVLILAPIILFFTGTSTPADTPNALQSFYIVSHVVSDASPFWYDYVLEVSPRERGTLIREVRIAPLNSFCARPITVKAVERVIPNSRVNSIAKVALCSLDDASVESAIKAATPNSIASIDDAVGFTIVAKCGTKDRVFDLPYKDSIDYASLKRASPSVAALWNLSYQVTRHVFGKHFSFYGVSSSEDAAFQELGSRLAPDLKAGIYDQAFALDGSLSSAMKDYIGPIEEQDPAYVELLDPTAFHFDKYVSPRFPTLARQARIEGEVRLTITVDAQTGRVKDVEAASGHKLLQDAAVTAAHQWQFRTGGKLPESFEVGLRFGLRCPSWEFLPDL